MCFPTGMSAADFARIPERHREDAMQEAWLAYLRGEDVRKYVHAFVVKEQRHERRERAMGMML